MNKYKEYTLNKNNKDISVSFFTYPSRGYDIQGYFIQEEDVAAKQPVIFYLRGGVGRLGTISEKAIESKLSFYASRGYTVVGTNYIEKDINNEFIDKVGGQENKDIYALLDIISKNPTCDVDNIIFIGGSRAGINAIQLVNNFPGLKAVSLNSAVFDLQEAFVFRLGLQKKYHGFFNTLRPENMEARLASTYAPFNRNVAFSLQHGTADDKVSVQQTIDFAHLLDQSKVNYVLDIKEGEDHFYHPKEDIVVWLDVLFKKNNT